MSQQPDISIVTPCFNSLPFLKMCARSVADQEGVRFEHIVVDGGSCDGTPEWLASQSDLQWISEPDQGPHDAENKGFMKAKGNIWAYLNADEQYLPGALARAKSYFDEHPEVDIMFGDFLAINADGSLIAFRKGFQPRWPYIMASHLYVFTCTMFFRRKIFDDGYRFNPTMKFTGDQDFVLRVMRAGYRARHTPGYLATYVLHSDNMSATHHAEREKRATLLNGPAWVCRLRWILDGLRYAEKAISGAYIHKGPLTYRIYPDPDAKTRRTYESSRPSFFWRRPILT